jgi:hypothetical protein
MGWDQAQLDKLNNIKDCNIGSLLREGSEFNFLDIKEKVQFTISVIERLLDNYEFWQQLPEVDKVDINNKVDQIIQVFEKMSGFDSKRDNAWSERAGIISSFESQYKQFYSYLVEKLNSFLGQKAYSQELSSKFGEEAKIDLAEIRKYKKEIEKIKIDVQNAQTISGDIASTVTANFFDSQAEIYKELAKRWLIAVICSGVVVFIISVIFSLSATVKINNLDAILNNSATLAVHIIILSITLISLKFSIKNYSANQHLYVVNKHRANVLKSMEAFRTSAASDESKDTVLISAVNAAFGHIETGLISTKEGAGSSGGDEASNSLVSIISMLKK